MLTATRCMTRVARPSAQARLQHSGALTAVAEYFQAMVTADEGQKNRKRSPKYLPGAAGNQAMNLWESIYAAEGEVGVARADKELDVFVWSVRGKQLWKFLVRTPDVLIEKDRKIEVLRDHLQTMGCSPLFVEQMSQLFNEDNLALLEQIADDFHAINREHRREVDVVLFTPAAVDAATLDFYKATIALNYLKEGDNLIFSHHVDKNITAGYRVSVKDKVYDFSRDAPRKAFFSTLELQDNSRLGQHEGRVKAEAPTTEGFRKEFEHAKKELGIDAAWEENFEKQAAARLEKFAAARVDLVNKLRAREAHA